MGIAHSTFISNQRVLAMSPLQVRTLQAFGRPAAQNITATAKHALSGISYTGLAVDLVESAYSQKLLKWQVSGHGINSDWATDLPKV